MAELIDREELLQAMQNRLNDNNECIKQADDSLSIAYFGNLKFEDNIMIGFVKEQPTVEKHRQGKWIKIEETNFGIMYQCSECGRTILTESIGHKKLSDFPYCHCGAKMK